MSAFVPLTPDQITIAVTVYSRRQYIKRAITSALNQTQPVRVIVVEDCGPDSGLQDFVRGEFGKRIEYVRNPQRRGLFDNWNACLEHCQTAWLSLLHDDDYLALNFVETMIDLSRTLPGCGLYSGRFSMVDEQGLSLATGGVVSESGHARRISLQEMYSHNPLSVAGTLFSASAVRAVGGFNRHSQFAGDWEMWAKLVAGHGAAATNDPVAYVLGHYGADRGSAVIERSGRKEALDYVQRKRIASLLNGQGTRTVVDRRAVQAAVTMSLRSLLQNAAGMSPRLLRYNLRLMGLSRSPNWQHAVGSALLRLLGVGGVQRVSQWWNGRKRPLPGNTTIL